MAYVTSGKITLGTSYDYDNAISEIATLFSVSKGSDGKYHLSDVLKSSNINKWAFYKPVRHSTKSNITDAQRSSVSDGISLVAATKILAKTIGATASSTYTKDQCLAEIAGCSYSKPRGASYSEYFRLRDLDGYVHSAVGPDAGWGQITFNATQLSNLSSISVTVTSSGNYAGYNFKLDPKLSSTSTNIGLYDKFSMKFNNRSGYSMGSLTSNMNIPIDSVLPSSGYWRICLAIWIPDYGWGIISGRMTLSQYLAEDLGTGNFKYLMPDFGTNPHVCSLINTAATSSGVKTFTAVPLLVKNISNTMIGGKFCLYPTSDTQMYCMPSGSTSGSVYIDIISASDVEGATVVKILQSGWYIAYRATGATAGSGSNSKPVQMLFVGNVKPVTTAASIRIVGTTRTTNPGATSQTTASLNTTVTVNAGATLTINGKTYYGVSLKTGPALIMKESELTTFTVS